MNYKSVRYQFENVLLAIIIFLCIVSFKIPKKQYAGDITIASGIDTLKNDATIRVYLTPQPQKEDYFKQYFPVLTLLLGIGLNQLIQYVNKRRRIKKAGERWDAEIRSLEGPINEQIIALQSNVDKHDKNETYDIDDPIIYKILEGDIFNIG
jgi:hypothetical protein